MEAQEVMEALEATEALEALEALEELGVDLFPNKHAPTTVNFL